MQNLLWLHTPFSRHKNVVLPRRSIGFLGTAVSYTYNENDVLSIVLKGKYCVEMCLKCRREKSFVNINSPIKSFPVKYYTLKSNECDLKI